jgi:acetyl esterase/lipase
MAVHGTPGDPKAKDPVDRESSAIQAVACLYPPTDFLNYGKPGEDAVGFGTLQNYKGAFGAESDTPEGRQRLGKEVSPIYFITGKLPPTFIIHGDQDFLVPIQQSETFVAKAKEAGATAKLVVKPGAAHGWADRQPDYEQFAEWFDAQLRRMKK